MHRRAIERAYLRKGKKKNLEAAIDSIAGIWAGRDDIGSTENYIRSLRKGKRFNKKHTTR